MAIQCTENSIYSKCSDGSLIFHAFISDDADGYVYQRVEVLLRSSPAEGSQLQTFDITHGNLFEATGLFIVVFLWFLSLMSNEFRQLILAKKNNDVKDSYFTTTISGNMVDIMSLFFISIGFIFHTASFYIYGDVYPAGLRLINPQFDADHFNLYCPFYLPKYLVISQAS